MCFSASASFSLSGILVGVGGASIAREPSGPRRMFAAIPILFAIQQAAEGTVWMTIGDPARATLEQWAVAAFLGLALVVWPVWLPMSLRRAERNPARRRLLTALSCWGCLVAAAALFLLTRWQPIAVVAGHHIRYDRAGSSDLPRDLLVLLAYVIPTIVPLFVSTLSLARVIGTMTIVSLAAAALVERDTMTSVWCFFAGLLSCLVLVAVNKERALSQ